jgi:hypothetical protein
MLALLTLPRGVPVEPALELADAPREEPVGIVIRPGPVPTPASGAVRPRPSQALG